MKQILLFIIAIICLIPFAKAQNPNSILGFWLSDTKKGKIEIFQSGNKYYGKLVWATNLVDAKGVSRKDINNPNEKLKNRPLLNAVLFTDFIYKDGEWDDGKIYDPTSGKTYSGTMKVKGDNLEIRGYLGISLFGKTKVWQRVK